MKRKKELQCEVKDVMETINRFIAVNNKKRLGIIGAIVAFDKEGDIIPANNLTFGFGNKEDLRFLLNELRDRVEDNAVGEKVDF